MLGIMAIEQLGFFSVPHLLYHGTFPRTGDTHKMKILLSVNWNISESPLNNHDMITEIRKWTLCLHHVGFNDPVDSLYFQYFLNREIVYFL